MWIVKNYEETETINMSEAIDKWLSDVNYVFIQIFDGQVKFLCRPRDNKHAYQFSDIRNYKSSCKYEDKNDLLKKLNNNYYQYYLFKSFRDFMYFAKDKDFSY